MSSTIRSFILSPAAKRAETGLTWLLLTASAAGLLLIFTGHPQLAPYISAMAVSSLGIGNGAKVARHLAATQDQRGRFPHRDAACAAMAISIYPVALLANHLEGRLFQLAVAPILLSMLYLLYALWPLHDRKDSQ